MRPATTGPTLAIGLPNQLIGRRAKMTPLTKGKNAIRSPGKMLRRIEWPKHREMWFRSSTQSDVTAFKYR